MMNNVKKLFFSVLWLLISIPQLTHAQDKLLPPAKELYVSFGAENFYTHQSNNFINFGVNLDAYLSDGVSLSWQLNLGIPLLDKGGYMYFKSYPGFYFAPLWGLSLGQWLSGCDGCDAPIESMIGGVIIGTVVAIAIPESLNFHFDMTDYTKLALYVTPLTFEFHRNFGGPYNNDDADLIKIPQGSYEFGLKLHMFDPNNTKRNTIYLGVRNSYNLPNWGIVAGFFASL